MLTTLKSPGRLLDTASSPFPKELSSKWAEALASGGRSQLLTHSDPLPTAARGSNSALVAAGEVHLRANHYASAARLFAAANAVAQWRLATSTYFTSAIRMEVNKEGQDDELSTDEIKKQALKLAGEFVVPQCPSSWQGN